MLHDKQLILIVPMIIFTILFIIGSIKMALEGIKEINEARIKAFENENNKVNSSGNPL